MSDNVVPFTAGQRDPREAILERIQAAAPLDSGGIDAAGAGASPAPSGAAGSKPSHLGGAAGQGRQGGAGEARPPGDEGDWSLRCARLPLTDLGNAQRFVLRHGDEFLFVPEWGWLAWDGRRWNRSAADGLLAKAVHDTIMAIRQEADALVEAGEDFLVGDPKDNRAKYLSEHIKAWGKSSQSAAHIGCIARSGGSNPGLVGPYLTASADDFDVDPMLLNVANGTLRFSKGPTPGPSPVLRQAQDVLRQAQDEGGGEHDGDYVTFTPHDRRDRITRLAPVEFDPDAACPVYDEALARVQPDDAMRRHLHCWGGVSLTGDVSLQRMAFWYGKGGNMKSTLLDAWAAVAGDYATTVGVETFLDQGRTRRGGDATPDLADLMGVRMLKTTEPERGAKLAEALIKTATGDEHLKVRFLNKDFFPLRVQFHLTMFGNSKPTIAGTDDGIWRRVVFVPWLVQVPVEARDRELLGKLKREASGILNRLLDGIRDFLDNGLVMPDAIVAATAAFRAESDPLGRFVEACIETRDGARTQSSSLYRLYQAWCVANSEKCWTATGFSRALGEKGFRRKQSNVMFWLDVAAKRSVSEFVRNFEAPPDRWEPLRQDSEGERGGLVGGGPGGDNEAF